MWKIFPKVRNPWLYQKYHRANRSRLKKVTLFAPDWFSKPYSPQSKNTQFKGVLWGQFAPANGRTERPREGRDLPFSQFQYVPLPGMNAIPAQKMEGSSFVNRGHRREWVWWIKKPHSRSWTERLWGLKSGGKTEESHSSTQIRFFSKCKYIPLTETRFAYMHTTSRRMVRLLPWHSPKIYI